MENCGNPTFGSNLSYSIYPIGSTEGTDHKSNMMGSGNWRSGKWTTEEEEYAEKLVEAFQLGIFHLTPAEGKTMRSFLAKKLNCNPMRISKKFAGFEGLGARFKPATDVPNERREQYLASLRRYELKFYEKNIELQARKKRKIFFPRSSHSEFEEALSSSFRQSSGPSNADDEKMMDALCDFDKAVDHGIFNESSYESYVTSNNAPQTVLNNQPSSIIITVPYFSGHLHQLMAVNPNTLTNYTQCSVSNLSRVPNLNRPQAMSGSMNFGCAYDPSQN